MATIELKLSPKIIEWIADKQGVSTLSLAQDLKWSTKIGHSFRVFPI